MTTAKNSISQLERTVESHSTALPLKAAQTDLTIQLATLRGQINSSDLSFYIKK